jgi:hypothetical protein
VGINEIHRSGLLVHAAGCEADMKTVLQHKKSRTSAIKSGRRVGEPVDQRAVRIPLILASALSRFSALRFAFLRPAFVVRPQM